MVGVRRDSARFNRACARLHRSIDEIKIASAWWFSAIWRTSFHFDVWPTQITANERQICFGNGKVCVDRIEPLNRQQHCAAPAPVAARHDVANIDKAQSCPAI